MSNPAFIVDGYTEKIIIQKLCPSQPVRRTDLNGKSVSISAIAKKVASLIRLLGNRYYPIVILVDKEQRDISFDIMAEQIREGIINEGIVNLDLRVGVANRMIENWIIADWETLTGGTLNEPENPDGGSGSNIIRRVKGSYDKTTDGVEYFLKVRQQIAYKKSESYKHFVDNLNGIPCDYLGFDR